MGGVNPAPADTNDGIRKTVWAATPVNKDRVYSPLSDRHVGVLCASIRKPRRRSGKI
nr:hypothetical protein [Mycobacterium leprae]